MEDYCAQERVYLKKAGGVHPAVLAVSIIRLFIWRHGPKDKRTIELLLDGLRRLRQEAKGEGGEFYHAEIEAYEMALTDLRIQASD